MDICPVRKIPCPHARVFHVTELKDGKLSKELHLCHECGPTFSESFIPLESIEKPDPIPAGLLSLMTIIAKEIIAKEPVSPPKPSYPPCPFCGMTVADFVQTGKLGCQICYDHYQKGLMTILARCQQGETCHVGKVPKNWKKEQQARLEKEEESLDREEKIRRLREKMANAIKVENYEVAGILKKKIEELQQ